MVAPSVMRRAVSVMFLMLCAASLVNAGSSVTYQPKNGGCADRQDHVSWTINITGLTPNATFSISNSGNLGNGSYVLTADSSGNSQITGGNYADGTNNTLTMNLTVDGHSEIPAFTYTVTNVLLSPVNCGEGLSSQSITDSSMWDCSPACNFVFHVTSTNYTNEPHYVDNGGPRPYHFTIYDETGGGTVLATSPDIPADSQPHTVTFTINISHLIGHSWSIEDSINRISLDAHTGETFAACGVEVSSTINVFSDFGGNTPTPAPTSTPSPSPEQTPPPAQPTPTIPASATPQPDYSPTTEYPAASPIGTVAAPTGTDGAGTMPVPNGTPTSGVGGIPSQFGSVYSDVRNALDHAGSDDSKSPDGNKGLDSGFGNEPLGDQPQGVGDNTARDQIKADLEADTRTMQATHDLLKSRFGTDARLQKPSFDTSQALIFPVSFQIVGNHTLSFNIDLTKYATIIAYFRNLLLCMLFIGFWSMTIRTIQISL